MSVLPSPDRLFLYRYVLRLYISDSQSSYYCWRLEYCCDVEMLGTSDADTNVRIRTTCYASEYETTTFYSIYRARLSVFHIEKAKHVEELNDKVFNFVIALALVSLLVVVFAFRCYCVLRNNQWNNRQLMNYVNHEEDSISNQPYFFFNRSFS